MMISGSCSAVARSISRVSFSPTTAPMLPMMKAESVTPNATRRARIMPRADDRRLAQAGAGLLGLEPLGVRFLVGEIQRIGRLEIRRTTPRTFLRRAPGDPLAGPRHTSGSRTRGRRPAARSASLRKIVCWQPGQRCQSPSGTPRLGRLAPACQELLVESLVAIDPLTRNLLPGRHLSGEAARVGKSNQPADDLPKLPSLIIVQRSDSARR